MQTTSFDAFHRPLAITYPNGEAVTMTYDREGENTVKAGTNLLVDKVTYNGRGQMARLERANGLDTVLSYYGATGASGTGNSNFRLSNMTAGSLLNLSYTYDKVGNVKTIGDNLIGNTQTFGYDHLHRLTSASAPAAGSVPAYSHSYGYNTIGNITSFAGTAYAYNDAAHKHAVTHLGGVQKFWYDANGNPSARLRTGMTKRIDGSVTYDPQVYDVENRLISVNKVGTGTTTFAYDAAGQRVKTTEPGGKIIYYPFSGYEEEINGATTTRRSTYAIAGQAIAIRVQIVGGSNTLYYLFSDHLGSSSVMSNSSGGKISGSEARYLPFGGYRTTPTTNPSITDRGFTGQKHNNSLGLIYYNARFYVPYINRFISADTIVPDPANPQSFNRYSYALNNPVKYTDPSGHCVFAPPFDTAVCIALLALVLTGDSAQPPLPPPNYPVNDTGKHLCNSPLPACFGDTVYLKDFAGHGEDNPIPIAEFEEFADKVAEDLYSHDLSWPGYSAGRGAYDTPFYNNGQSERRTNDPNAVNGLWPADQQVCIETIGCSGRSEINYIAQGMWGAATGEPLPVSEAIVRLWKGWEYMESPSEDTLSWLQYGYDYYQRWLEEQK